jgi:hypothetical protein
VPDAGDLSNHDDVPVFDDELTAPENALDRLRRIAGGRKFYR